MNSCGVGEANAGEICREPMTVLVRSVEQVTLIQECSAAISSPAFLPCS